MADDNPDPDDGEITVKRERTILQKEELTVKSKRGTGTNDRDEVRKHLVREAELDVPDESMLDDEMPTLIGKQQEGAVVGEVVSAMEKIRKSSND